jgi:hypothetical protein
MDEQESILELVDGVLTLVPKDKSISMNSDEEKSEEQEKNSIEDQKSNNDGKKRRRKKKTLVGNLNILNK